MRKTVSVRDALGTSAIDVGAALRQFGLRGWLLALVGAASTLFLIGVPTAIIDNPWFIRMTPTRTQDYAIWIATALLAGLVVGTFARSPARGGEGKVLSGGLLSFLAVGCAVCNKLVVLLLGVSGALTFFAPVQIYLGLASLALLAWSFRLRARAIAGSCPIPEVAVR